MSEPAPLSRSLQESAKLVAAVASGRSLAEEFPRAAGESSRRAALLDLVHGTLRRYGRVQAIVRALSHRGHADVLVQALLWCSLYALDSRRYGEHTVVSQAVNACGLLERWSAKGYVNAVLRAYLRQAPLMQARLAEDAEALYQHPRWWIDRVRAAYPADWSSVLAAGNGHPPMCLRVNARRSSVQAYHEKLASEGIEAKHLGGQALLLARPVPVSRLPGFSEGEVSVQDAGAQRTASCLDVARGQRVLDACAAPGGKAASILETSDVELTALDLDAARCALLQSNLDRLALRARVSAADCRRPADWWTGQKFDRVLADVPCSGSGVARRHPDLKWLRREKDAESFAERQLEILDALWQVLAADGKLLYVTCSVFPGENENVVSAFIARTQDAVRAPLPDGAPAQWLPGPEHDGFYYALIKKQG